jgi:hypothetical protein
VATKKTLSNRTFLDCVRDYLPTDAAIHETDAQGNAAGHVFHDDLSENTFYRFDQDTLDAFCHAIAELALEEANGSLLAALQGVREVEHYRECIAQLASTLERVELVGSGRAPRGIRHVRFIRDSHGACRDIRLVLYEGRRAQAMLICRQTPAAPPPEDRSYVGFYTLNARLVRHIHGELVNVAQGRAAALREFLRLHTIDQIAKDLRREFLEEEKALSQVIRRLQLGGKRYRPAQFASDLEKGLSRLHQWKTRLPELMARAGAA